MSPRHNLEAIAQALYGQRWHVELAADLGVSTRTVRRWHDDPSLIDRAMRFRIAGIAQRRIEVADKALAALHRGTALDAKTIDRDFGLPAPSWIALKRNPQLALQIERDPEPMIAPKTERDFEAMKAKVAGTFALVAAYRASRAEAVSDPAVAAATEDVSTNVEQEAPKVSVSSVEDTALPSTKSLGIGKVAPPRKRVSKARREKLLAALTASDVRTNDVVKVRDAQGRLHRAMVMHSLEGRLYLMPLGSTRGLKNGALFEPDRFVCVAERPDLLNESDVYAQPTPVAQPEPVAQVIEPEPEAKPAEEQPATEREPEQQQHALYFETLDAMDRYNRRQDARESSLCGFGYRDLRVGDLIEIAYMGGERNGRITRFNKRGLPMYQSQQKGGRRPGAWDNEQILDSGRFLRVTHREGF